MDAQESYEPLSVWKMLANLVQCDFDFQHVFALFVNSNLWSKYLLELFNEDLDWWRLVALLLSVNVIFFWTISNSIQHLPHPL